MALGALGVTLGLKLAPQLIGLLVRKAEGDHPKGEDGVKTGPKKLNQVLGKAQEVFRALGIEYDNETISRVVDAVLALDKAEEPQEAEIVKGGQRVARPMEIRGVIEYKA